MTEVKEVFAIEVIAKTASINLDNINAVLKSVEMVNEDEDVVTFSDRVFDYSKERCSDGVKITFYIVNDGTEVMNRMDWLLGEEYVVSKVDAEITSLSTGDIIKYELVSEYGTQTTREINIVVDPALEKATNYLVDRLTEGNQSLQPVLFGVLKEDTYMQDLINRVIEIPVI